MPEINNLENSGISFLLWEQIFTGKIGFVAVGKKKGIKFEIRTREQGHNQPHCHVSYQSQQVSISLVNFKILAGNLKSKQKKAAIDWVKNNVDKLRNYWNEYSCIEV